MEILFFEPVYKDYLWGGNRLRNEFNKNTPYDITAESWEISANKNGKSIIKNGKYKGLDLEELFQKKDLRKAIFGIKCENLEEFPLLIKFIDANKNLSVQVHPDDYYAQKYEKSSGKTEMWYIMDCKEQAQIICGVKEGIEKKELENLIKNGKTKECLNYINIQKGDSILIRPGTLHAIMEDTLICEIQQNADLTYRVYDWDRVDKNGKPRELHIDKALDVINIDNQTNKESLLDIENQSLVDCSYFKVDKVKIDKSYIAEANINTFIAVNVVDGNGKIVSNGKEYEIQKGNSFIIPSSLGKFEIIGNLTILKSYL